MAAIQTVQRAARWWLDPIVLMLAVSGVLLGTFVGATKDEHDIDEVLFRSIVLHMQGGDGFYEAHVEGLIEKDGRPPSQVRSLRTPVLSTILEPLPEAAWRFAAVVPAFALCLSAAALAGPKLQARRVAAGLTGLWMVTALPLLYMHHELWGAALFGFGVLELRRARDRRAALLVGAATAVRELFGWGLLLGLALRRRLPWVIAVGVALVGAALHWWWASRVVDPAGYEPPMEGGKPFLAYVSPGSGDTALGQALGAVLLVAGAVGLWIRRHLDDQRFVALFAAPLVVGTALAGRTYWSLVWCGPVCAAAAVAFCEALRSR